MDGSRSTDRPNETSVAELTELMVADARGRRGGNRPASAEEA